MKKITYLILSFCFCLSSGMLLGQINLEVEGDARVTSSTPTITLFDNAPSENRIEGALTEFGDNIELSTYRGDLRFRTSTTGSPITRMSIEGSNGYVGLNTTNALAPLHIWPTSGTGYNTRFIGGAMQIYLNSTQAASISAALGALIIDNDQTPSAGVAGFTLNTKTTGGTASNRMLVDSNGDVGIGNYGSLANVGSVVELRHNIGAGDFRNDGVKMINSAANGRYFTFYVTNGSGDLEVFSSVGGTSRIGWFNGNSGTYNVTSDERKKCHVEKMPSILDKVNKLNAVSYNFKSQESFDKRFVGIMAQDLNKDFPELVSYEEKQDVYSVDYSALGVLAIKSIQEQQAIIEKLMNKIEDLEETVKELQK